MVSKEAEERRLRFQAAKEAAGGLAGLIRQELSKKPKVYFLEDGTIVSISKEEIELKTGWKVREFDEEQVQILENKNWNLFYVKKDSLVDNLYSIESRPLESLVVSAENNSMLLVDYATKGDCICSITESSFKVKLSAKELKTYLNIDINHATANGQKVLKFYFTAPNDPHTMLHSEYISLAKLLENKNITIPMNEDFRLCSIYTVKAFNSYSRV